MAGVRYRDPFDILQVEFNEWTRVNRALRQHGLPSIDLAHPGKVERKTDIVMFESEMSTRLRENYQALMTDCERRQELVQELISTNNQLREELKAQTVVSERYESRARDLKLMLDTSKIQMEDLQEEVYNTTSSQQHEGEKMKNTQEEVKARCKQLKHKCDTYQAEIDRLSDKLRKITEEEDRRVMKQRQVFQQLKKNTGRGSLDDKVLDIIDSYEKQIFQLQKELDHYRPSDPNHTVTLDDNKENEGTPHYKQLVRTYEKQLRESKRKQKSLENEVEVIKLEIQGRPELKDYRECQTKMKRMERLVKKHNVLQMEEHLDKQSGRSYSTQLDDLDYLPLYHCRKYLKEMCEAVGVHDLDLVIPRLEKSTKAMEAYPKLEQFAKEVLNLADTPGMPWPSDYSRPHSHHHKHKVWCEKTWHHVIPVIQHWIVQLKALSELKHSVNKLNDVILPWRDTGLLGDHPEVTSVVEALDAIIYEVETDNEKPQPKNGSKTKDQASRAMLQGIIDHFMNLFDVNKVTGCYARMNDIYTKLGETHNVLKTLRDLLGLNKDAKCSVIVDSVVRLCELQNASTYSQLNSILPGEDIESIVRKVRVHEEFFPVFQEIIKKLMDILDVRRIDQVVPTVRSIKLLADGRRF